MFKVLLLLSAVVVATLADGCLSPPPVKNFQKDKFAGTWRYQLVVGNTLLGPVERCMASKISSSSDSIEILYEKDGQNGVVQGKMTSSNGGDLRLEFLGKNIKQVVLDTDYVTYHVSYFCDIDNPQKSTVEVFLRSRERNEALIQQKIKEAQKIVHITTPSVNVDQSNCSN